MKAARIVAVGIVVAAGAWIASGHLLPHDSAESRAAVQPNAAAAPKLFRVSVAETRVEPRSRKLVLSGRTEADRKMMVTARGDGVVRDPLIHRRVLTDILAFAEAQGCGLRGLVRSPLLGPKGNTEFLVWLAPGTKDQPADALIEEVMREKIG